MWNNELKNTLRILALCAFGAGTPLSARAEVVTPIIGVAGEQYASESSPASRVDITGMIRSETLLYGKTIPTREMHLYSFFETGEAGDKSFDLDTVVMRFRASEQSHFWIGRNHPLYEGFEFSEDARVSNTSAIGANWVQNQSDALTPRVTGWIGAGFHYEQPGTGMYFTTAFSPVFLPSFGPRVSLSEDDAASGSRFGNLPPASIDLNNNGILFPMRYRVNISDLKDILFQPQFFAAIGQDNDFHRLTLMTWSAPSPAPQVMSLGKVHPQAAGTTVLVVATPDFVRENFLGAQWTAKQVAWQPTFETVWEWRSGRVTASASATPAYWLNFGLMAAANLPVPDASTGIRTPAPYDKDLVWLELDPTLKGSRFRPSLRIEQHLTAGYRGRWVRPLIGYQLSRITSFYAMASILTGPEASYFGNWRALDSVAVGARFLW